MTVTEEPDITDLLRRSDLGRRLLAAAAEEEGRTARRRELIAQLHDLERQIADASPPDERDRGAQLDAKLADAREALAAVEAEIRQFRSETVQRRRSASNHMGPVRSELKALMPEALAQYLKEIHELENRPRDTIGRPWSTVFAPLRYEADAWTYEDLTDAELQERIEAHRERVRAAIEAAVAEHKAEIAERVREQQVRQAQLVAELESARREDEEQRLVRLARANGRRVETAQGSVSGITDSTPSGDGGDAAADPPAAAVPTKKPKAGR